MAPAPGLEAAGLVGDDPFKAAALEDELRAVAGEAPLTGLMDKDNWRCGLLAACMTSETFDGGYLQVLLKARQPFVAFPVITDKNSTFAHSVILMKRSVGFMI